ncbi:carbon starvation protein CstA [Planctopirus limnophila DSM 3776]|uniref:Carbon starvation protein CstA n=2 Tax=Planctopirus limnophila TaxID=120 RepID=D5SN73_PLAL2|nr:carbon starvation protein CstA [Planctopirus limnophila DSM 3776]
MGMLGILIGAAILLYAAWRLYGPVLARLLELDNNRPTPAVTQCDHLDYEPIEPNALLSQHFSAIAAAGPIVGPIVAGIAFGWLPAILWILVGAIFVGGVHDITALVASIRHKARSIAEVVREHMSRRAFLLFLSFVWLALVYIVVAFTDITARAFVGQLDLGNGEVVSGGGIASSSLIYLLIPIIMGVTMRYTKLSLGWATIIFLPLVGLSVYVGQLIPLDMESLMLRFGWATTADEAKWAAIITWDLLLLFYCCLASIAPMWLLLQPRGHLGGYFLYVALIGGAAGLIVGSLLNQQPIQYPMFRGWQPPEAGNFVFPMLFILIACGACSGFHALIASGTTSKQLRVESDARVVGYGAMLLEAMVAILSLACVMRLSQTDPLLTSGKLEPNVIYATGLGSFLQTFGIPASLAVSFALMAFTTFVYDTLDVCTRLGRYIIQELTGWQGWGGRWFGTIISAAAPAFFVTQQVTNLQGKVVPSWEVFWPLFGASNQLLAALTLLGVTVWLWQTRRAAWVWIVTGLPTVLMYTMSLWALGVMTSGTWQQIQKAEKVAPVSYVIITVSSLLIVLALLMLIEAIMALTTNNKERAIPVTTPA